MLKFKKGRGVLEPINILNDYLLFFFVSASLLWYKIIDSLPFCYQTPVFGKFTTGLGQ